MAGTVGRGSRREGWKRDGDRHVARCRASRWGFPSRKASGSSTSAAPASCSETSSPPELGAIAKLKFSVGGEPLATDVEVRRVTAAPGGYRVGARFVEMTPTHRRLIERFMGQ